MHGSFSFVIGENTSPDRVTPYPEESLRSIITRFAERTGHDSPRVLDTFFEQGALGKNKSIDELSTLAEMLGYPLKEVLFRHAAQVNGNRHVFARVSIGGQDLQASYYSRMVRAVSPSSLRKAPYHRHYWDISPLGFCPESLEILIRDCPNPQCGRPLTCGGTSVCHCHRCGYDLRNAKTKRLKAGDKYNLPVLALMFSLDPKVQVNAKSSLPTHLHTLDATELLNLIIFFGGNVLELSTEERNRLRIITSSGRHTEKSIELLGNGLVILKYIDEYIFDVLDMVLEERWKLRKERPYLHELGAFTHLMDPTRQDEPVRDFVAPFLKRYFNQRYFSLRRKCLGTTLARWSDKALVIKDAMSEFPLSRYECNLLLRTNYASVGARIGKAEKCLDRVAVAEYLKQRDRFRRFRDITRDERVPFEAIANLARFVGFSRVPPELVGPLKAESCPQEEWEAFKRSCEEKLQPGDDDVCSITNIVLKSNQKISGWINLFELLASGSVVLAGIKEDEREVASRWLVARQKTLDAMGVARVADRRKTQSLIREGSDLWPMKVASREIGVRSEKASELVANGFLHAVRRSGASNRHDVAKDSLESFKRTFVAVSDLCVTHDMSAVQVVAWLKGCGINPIKGDISPVFFRRSDVQHVIDAGIKKYGHASDEAKAGKVAYLQLYDFPPTWTASELVKLAVTQAVPVRQARFMSLANMLRGMSPREAIIGSKIHLSTLINIWIPTFRADGIGGRTAQAVGNARMTETQRASFEAFARSIMVDPTVLRPEISNKLQDFARVNFGIEYRRSAITKLLRRANIKYPEVRAARLFSDDEVIEILGYACATYVKIRAGDLSRSIETVRAWAEEQFNVSVCRNTISRLLRQHGLEPPSNSERSAIVRKFRAEIAITGANSSGSAMVAVSKSQPVSLVEPNLWDLDGLEWRLIQPLLPLRGACNRTEDTKVISGIIYILGTGKAWRELPDKYGAISRAYSRFHTWRRAGVWNKICATLKSEHPGSKALEALSRASER